MNELNKNIEYSLSKNHPNITACYFEAPFELK